MGNVVLQQAQQKNPMPKLRQYSSTAESICYPQLFHRDINFIRLPCVTGKRETYMRMYSSW
jgi:hypothetical protein